jgi:hypothetical protein
MRIELDRPFLTDGIRSTHFFNGRLLSAEDLSREQEARARSLQRLGRSLGEGIAQGLLVSNVPGVNSITSPAVAVTAGLAINRLGQVLELAQGVEVSLLQSSASGATGASAAMSGFGPLSAVADSQQGRPEGVYLLVLGPAEGREGLVVRMGLDATTQASDAKLRVEGVRFRLLRLDVSNADLAEPLKLRNRVAHHCLGTTDVRVQSFIGNLFGPVPERYGLIDALRDGRLSDAEVPLAVLHWTATGGIQFVDRWAARRALSRPAVSGRFSALVSERRLVEREAQLLQFQEHLEALRQGTPGTVVATQHFRYLPAAGVVPLSNVPADRGFALDTFFQGITRREPAFIEGARVEALLRESLTHPPIDLSQAGLLWLYRVRENQPADSSAGQPLPYVVFASVHLPYAGDARFNVSPVNQGSYALE